MNRVHFSSDHPEHYSPPEIVAAAGEVLGRIDLDPCGPVWGPPTVPARTIYRLPDIDGLAAPWRGTVYLNPPYGRTMIHWIGRLTEGYAAGAVPAAIALVPARTDTAWWNLLTPHRPAVCLVRGRLTFGGPASAGNAPFPSAVIYLGPRPGRFAAVFGPWGPIWRIAHADPN